MSNLEIVTEIISTRVKKRVEVVSVTRFVTTDLMYTVQYKVDGEEGVSEDTITEIDILQLKVS